MITLHTFCENCKQELISEIIDTEVIITPCQYCSRSSSPALPTLEDFKAVLVCQYRLLKHCSVPDNEYDIMSKFMDTLSQEFGYATWVDAHTTLLDWRING